MNKVFEEIPDVKVTKVLLVGMERMGDKGLMVKREIRYVTGLENLYFSLIVIKISW